MNEKLIKYFADEMNSSEKAEFEKTINSSPALQKEITKYRNFLSDISETVNPDVDESYFINLVPNFRAKLERGKKKKYNPVFSFATAVLSVVILLLFIPHTDKIIRNENPVADYSNSEISDFLTINSDQPIVTNLPADVEANYDSVIDGMIYSELNINDANLAETELLDRLDYNSLLQGINSSDASTIYEQLKNKKIF